MNENPDNATNAEVLGIEAINMSFGFPDNPYSSRGTITCQIMHALLDAGILVGAAAGELRVLSADILVSPQAVPLRLQCEDTCLLVFRFVAHGCASHEVSSCLDQNAGVSQ